MAPIESGSQPNTNQSFDHRIGSKQPDDLRFNGSLPRYLWLAPPNEDLTVIYHAWINGLDPREVWADDK